MRILIVNNYAHITGGADLHCLEITEGLRDRGHDVRWLSTESSKNVERAGAFIRRTVGTDNRDDVPLSVRFDVARKALWNREAAAAMKSLAADFEPDVVHVHKAYVQLSVAPVVVASKRNIPLVQTVHDYEFLSASSIDSTGGRWDRDESRLSYRALNSATFVPRRIVHRPRVDSWIAVSRTVAEIYKSIGGIDCEVIPNFVAAPEAESNDLSHRSGALYLGRLAEEKGVDHVLDAAERLPDVSFTIAGSGPLEEAVRNAATRLRNVDYRGFVSGAEAEELMKQSVVCLMPSLWQEPGPLSCLEAMANGTPVVCYANGGLAEYVADSGAGIVCSHPTSDCLASAIAELNTNADRWRLLSEGALTGSSERHSRRAYLDSLEAQYEATIATSS